jgi:hypothetical protein
MPLFILALLGIGAYLFAKNAAASSGPPPGQPVATGNSFNPLAAIPVTLPGGTTTVPYGASIDVQPTQVWSNITTNNATVVTPTMRPSGHFPPSMTGFVAVGRGTATLTGTFAPPLPAGWLPGQPVPPPTPVSATIIVQ